jgi:two-component system, OmpR family, response regulator NblR
MAVGCVMVVTAEAGLALQMRSDLLEGGYDVTLATDRTTALEQLSLAPALIVVDRVLSGESGLALCKALRQTGCRTPIVLMMAKEAVEDRVACIEAGADDYALKPYRSDVFLQLVQLYLKPSVSEQDQLRFGDLVLSLASRQVRRRGRAIDLTMKEFELLRYLMEHPREVLTREQILENVWGYEFVGESNVIEVYIRYLRIKIEDEGDKRLIQTVRGVGYVLREP